LKGGKREDTKVIPTAIATTPTSIVSSPALAHAPAVARKTTRRTTGSVNKEEELPVARNEVVKIKEETKEANAGSDITDGV
jgi:hypothetical protein